MGSANKRNRSVFIREYTVETPTNTVEVAKAVHWATQDWMKDHPDQSMSDDSLTVEADDEKITISYVVKDETWRGQDPPQQ